MTKINPRIDKNGEPVCNGKCPSLGIAWGQDHCAANKREVVYTGESCIPGLREQRDKAIDERAELQEKLTHTRAHEKHIQLGIIDDLTAALEREKALQRELCIWAENKPGETRTVEELSMFFWGTQCFETEGDK